jgi:hypothetical protein
MTAADRFDLEHFVTTITMPETAFDGAPRLRQAVRPNSGS